MIDPSIVSGIYTELNHGEFPLWYFLSIVILVFCLVLVLTGAFTIYFGSGRSRAIGGALLFIGLLIGGVYVLMASSYWPGGSLIDAPIQVIIWETFVYLAATIVGALIGLGIFLAAIMKA